MKGNIKTHNYKQREDNHKFILKGHIDKQCSHSSHVFLKEYSVLVIEITHLS